mgnify:CR=1 FL=1
MNLNKHFPNRYQLWKFLEPYCNGIDFNNTLRHRLGCYKMEDSDEVIFTHGAKDLFTQLNEKFNLKIDTKLSYFFRDQTMLFWDESGIQMTPDEVVENALKGSQGASKEEEVTLVESSFEESVDDSQEGSEDDTELSEGVKEVDWEWVESLENNKEDKLKLDEYSETFGVKLSRVKKLENMIIDFKEALDK